jgi:hypothetical protein
MSEVLTQTTANDDPEGQVEPRPSVAIRWVYPLPVRPPLWLERAEIVLGRDSECDESLEGGRVSRKHARLSRSGPLWLVSDLDSKNGLFVNGRRVRSVVLEVGDVLRVGDHVGVCVLAQPGADLSCGDLGYGIVGGRAHRAALQALCAVAKSSLPVVIEGETGTGKERFAAALHTWSGRPGRLSAVNCAVYSKAVAAAELFGYRKGAFTGAEHASPGHIRAAEGGTLLLDELIELPLEVQAMLLRAIEQREVLPLGESRPTPVDVRFVAATQVPLASAVEAGTFRSDLRARLEGAVVRLPSLADCKEIDPSSSLPYFSATAGRVRSFRPASRSGSACTAGPSTFVSSRCWLSSSRAPARSAPQQCSRRSGSGGLTPSIARRPRTARRAKPSPYRADRAPMPTTRKARCERWWRRWPLAVATSRKPRRASG